ncbi:hypothetical protein BDQ12DRAFT_730108 [Crucibulum laeve]|uniref:Uncharacterized protein n=1 Tax=Crucibulum laeve TaxID=68775 RepID=A0A5C3LDY3_9AGAR|nr:hypothetical protein BDQ12DRAFT_730108 [Crucibulum laeve]
MERRAKSLEAQSTPTDRKLVIWTSTRRRAHHTAWPFLASAQSLATHQGHMGQGIVSAVVTPEPETIQVASPEAIAISLTIPTVTFVPGVDVLSSEAKSYAPLSTSPPKISSLMPYQH